MSIAEADIAFAKELFSGLGDVTSRKMMGGLCLYHDGTIFAIIHPPNGFSPLEKSSHKNTPKL